MIVLLLVGGVSLLGQRELFERKPLVHRTGGIKKSFKIGKVSKTSFAKLKKDMLRIKKCWHTQCVSKKLEGTRYYIAYKTKEFIQFKNQLKKLSLLKEQSLQGEFAPVDFISLLEIPSPKLQIVVVDLLLNHFKDEQYLDQLLTNTPKFTSQSAPKIFQKLLGKFGGNKMVREKVMNYMGQLFAASDNQVKIELAKSFDTYQLTKSELATLAEKSCYLGESAELRPSWLPIKYHLEGAVESSMVDLDLSAHCHLL